MILLFLIFSFAVLVISCKINSDEKNEREQANLNLQNRYLERNEVCIGTEHTFQIQLKGNKERKIRFIADDVHEKVHILADGIFFSLHYAQITDCQIVVVEKENDEFENYMLGHIAAGPTGAALAAATETPEITLLMAMNFTDLKAPCKKEIILLQGNSEVTRENYAKAISFSQKVLATIQEITNKSLDANASPNAHSK